MSDMLATSLASVRDMMTRTEDDPPSRERQVQFQELIAFHLPYFFRYLPNLKAELDVLRNGHVLEKSIVLKDKAYIALLRG